MSDKNCVDIPDSFWETADMLAIARYCEVVGFDFSVFKAKFFASHDLYSAVSRRGLTCVPADILIGDTLGLDYRLALELGNTKLTTAKQYEDFLSSRGYNITLL